MSDTSQGAGWWIASDGKWYSPEQHPDYVAPPLPIVPDSPTDVGIAAADASNTFASSPAASSPVAPTNIAATPPTPGPTFVASPSAPVTSGPATAAPLLGEGHDVGLIGDSQHGLPQSTDSSSSRRGLLLGIGVLVLAIVLGFLAFRFFGGGSNAGGASSPEAAMGQLIASVNERDAVGFVDVFDPDEIEAWFGSFSPAIRRAENASQANSDAEVDDLRDAYEAIFSAFDFSLTGPGGDPITYDVQPLDSNGRISRVRVEALDFELTVEQTDRAIIGAIGGDASGLRLNEIDGTRIEMRDESAGLALRLFVPGEPVENDVTDGGHFDMVTVQKDGKWFISIGYSMLELARSQGEFDDEPAPDFGRAFELVDSQTGGAETPDAAVRDMFESIETLDYENIIRLIDPLGTPYLHDYQPLIDNQVDEEDRRQAVRDASLSFDELDLGVSEWEGRTLVTMTTIEAQAAEGRFSIDTENWCAMFRDETTDDQICLEDGLSDMLFELDSDQNPSDFIPAETGIVVIERNGRWYLDPLGTMGYYADQIADDLGSLADDLDGRNPATELGGRYFLGTGSSFLIVEGPIASQGKPATQLAESGSVAVALDLDEYPTVSDGFDELHVALAKVTTNETGTFISEDQLPLDGEDWFAVWDSDQSTNEIPAIAATTNGSMSVELFDAEITAVSPEGFVGQFDTEGRPQIFTLTGLDTTNDITLQGAEAISVYGWEENGIGFPERYGSAYISAGVLFVIVTGEPGASFEINVSGYEPEPEPEPTPEADDGFVGFDDPIVDSFSQLVNRQGYEYSIDQPGGFFDGCGGPNDPDVRSWVFDGPDGALLVLTPYGSTEQATSAFASLANVSSPCEAFSGLDVNAVTLLNLDETLIEWQFSGDPSSLTFEHYRLVGDTIVVASNSSALAIEDQLAILNNW